MPGDDTDPTGLSTRFSFDRPTLWFGRMRLESDSVVLVGWRLTGRYRRRIPLDRITYVDVPAADKLLLWLTSGRTVRLRIDSALFWKDAIQAHQDERERSK